MSNGSNSAGAPSGVDALKALVARYYDQRDIYRAPDYGETEVRQEFLNPLFRILGWDVDNSSGQPDPLKDVIHEDSIKLGTHHGAPDYCFRTGGSRGFFVEAKRPRENLRTGYTPSYQLRSYGWSATLPLNILTNFEEFSIYDCRSEPAPHDGADVARLNYFTADTYEQHWETIWNFFSKSAVISGSLQRYAASAPQRGAFSVDQAFLNTIESWRIDLAQNIRGHNELTLIDLNYAIQQTIDRIIFLRIAEDRGMSEYGALEALLSGGDTYRRLRELFVAADKKYNSGLFHFHKETGRLTPPDTLTPKLVIDDRPLKAIIRHLYFPKSPYRFNVIPPEILGKVYENFLGNTVTIKGHAVTVEPKPEVRKAGGVYYTPAHVVHQMVRATILPVLQDATRHVEKPIRVLDPACGSGSFLVAAYELLLDYHMEQYLKSEDKYVKGRSPRLYQRSNGSWALTLQERQRILLSSIFGLDIDKQAVEVSKLSLSLKMLEGETQETLDAQMRLFNLRALPDLDRNILSGNFIVKPDFFDFAIGLSETELQRINPYDLDESSIGRRFDVIIGNPPWGASLIELEKQYLSQRYPTIPTKVKDTYLYFSEEALTHLRRSGALGFILPNTWMLINSLSDFRERFLEKGLSTLVDYGDGIFKEVIAESAFIVLRPSDKSRKCMVSVVRNGKTTIDRVVDHAVWTHDPSTRVIPWLTSSKVAILKRIERRAVPFSTVADIRWGIKPYQVGYGKPQQTRDMVDRRVFHSDEAQNDKWKPLLVGGDVDRYLVHFPGNLYIKYGPWLMYPSSQEIMERPKLLMRQTSDILRVAYDETGLYAQNSIFLISSDSFDLRILEAVLNSELISRIYQIKNPQVGKIYAEIKPQVIKELPIPLLNNKSSTLTKSLIKKVELMTRIVRAERAENNPQNKEYLKRRQMSVGLEIEKGVAALYGIGAEELEATLSALHSDA